MNGEICGLPIPGTIGAETHCEHWHAGEPDACCCWCGSDEDDSDHPSCPAVATIPNGGVEQR